MENISMMIEREGIEEEAERNMGNNKKVNKRRWT